MRKSLPIIAFAGVVAAPGLVPGQEVNQAQRYEACMAEAKSAPQKAFEMALSWRGLGGGDAAEHCVAVALIGLKQFTEAANRLEALANKTKQTAPVKAGLLAHAAQAWILANKNARAEAVLTAALNLTPLDADLLVDRGQARAGQRNYNGAIEDLSNAIDSETIPANAAGDAYVFRATAYRLLDKLELALADIERALALRPDHPDGLLERGILRRLRDNDAGARQDWLTIIRLAPTSPAADLARHHLESMDVKQDK